MIVHTGEMTLDRARSEYEADPSAVTALIYLETAEEYHGAEMIEDGTLEHIRNAVAVWAPFKPLIEYLDGTHDRYAKTVHVITPPGSDTIAECLGIH